MRLFTAIALSDEARKHLSGVQAYLRRDGLDLAGISKVKWVELANLHVTLKFLGEVEEDRVAQIQRTLAQIEVEPMELFADRFERFPRKGLARVLAAGIGGDAGRVELLHRRILQACADMEIEADSRKFVPHVSMARSREGLAIGQENLAQFWPGPSFLTTKFLLVKSTLTEAAPVYDVLESFG